MIALASKHPQENLRIVDLPYRLSSWALDDPANVGVWEDETGTMVGWSVMQTPFWTLDFTCQPEVEPVLLPVMLAWADERAKKIFDSEYGHPRWFVMVFADHKKRIKILKRVGYASQADLGEDSWSKVFLLNDLQTPLKIYPAPKGFTVRTINGQSEVEAYVEMHREVFESRNMTVEWRSRTMKTPGYTPELDLVVEALDGKLAAFCIGWQMQGGTHTKVGQIEPLGCRAEYRHLALGRVVLAEVLHRMKTLGVQKVFVETDSYRNTAYRLYEALGFEKIRDVLVFRKAFKDNQN